MESAGGAHGAAGLCPCCKGKRDICSPERHHKQLRALIAIGANGDLGAMLFWFVEMVDTRSPTSGDILWRRELPWDEDELATTNGLLVTSGQCARLGSLLHLRLKYTKELTWLLAEVVVVWRRPVPIWPH